MSRKRLVLALVIINLCFVLGAFHEVSDGRTTMTVLGTSMQHGPRHQAGILDSGDGITVLPLGDDPLLTYYEGKDIGHSSFGDHGDVVVFSTGRARFVHRLVCYVRVNETGPAVTADIPLLGLYNVSEVVLAHFGFADAEVQLDFGWIFGSDKRFIPEGYLTKGDNLEFVDQMMSNATLVTPDMIRGKVGAVTDNEMVFQSAAELIASILLIAVCIGSYSVWFRSPEAFGHVPMIVLAVLVGLVLAHDLAFISSSDGVAGGDVLAEFMPALIPAVVVLLSIHVSGRIRTESRFARSVFFSMMFIPAYALFAAGSGQYLYSFLALSMIASLYSLRPDSVFGGRTEAEITAGYGEWQVLLGFNMLLLTVSLMMTLPPWFYLTFAWIMGNAYLVRAIRKGKRLNPKPDYQAHRVIPP
jgi:signal peptidase I